MRSSLAASLMLAGCTGPGVTHAPLDIGPLEEFAAEVQPVLAERCASGGCHGRPDRALSLFVPGGQRIDVSRLYVDEPLAEAELVANAERICALSYGERAEDSLVLRKPLSIHAGGCWHGGGDIFVDTTDPGYRAIARWLHARFVPDGGPR